MSQVLSQAVQVVFSWSVTVITRSQVGCMNRSPFSPKAHPSGGSHSEQASGCAKRNHKDTPLGMRSGGLPPPGTCQHRFSDKTVGAHPIGGCNRVFICLCLSFCSRSTKSPRTGSQPASP